MANLTDADKVIRNDVGKTIASKLDDIAYAIVQQGGGAHSLGQLSDVDIDTTTLAEGQSIVYNETTQKFENGEVSTVAALDDLTDVSITSAQKGDSLRNDGNGNWVNEPTTIKMTSAEWEAIADKQAWRNAHKNTYLVITDAPNLNATAQDISYDGGATTVKNKIDVSDVSSAITLNANFSDTSKYLYKSANVCSLEIRGKLTATWATTIAAFNNSAYYPKCSRVVTAYLDTDDPSATPNGAVWLYDNGNIVYFGNSVSSKNVIISVTYICKG